MALEIARIETFAVRLPRTRATGMAGSPTGLRQGSQRYRWSSSVRALYSDFIETALLKITLSDGTYGWGEAQAPLAPRVACTIVDDLLSSVLLGEPFDGSAGRITELWDSMYATMRVRGQTGGFMLDAISGVDLALWDLAGKIHGVPVSRLIAGEAAKPRVPAYLSGVTGADPLEFARGYYQQGFRTIKLFFDGQPEGILSLIDQLKEGLGSDACIALDALWQLELPRDEKFLHALEERNLRWLEAPFPPDLPEMHQELKRSWRFRLALGESYRTRYELAPFLGIVDVVQPDLGRSGITETIRISEQARNAEVIPHVSIALGPQIAAAIHSAAAMKNSPLCEYNPTVFEISNRYLKEPLRMNGPSFDVPQAPGLGIDIEQAPLTEEMV